MLMKEASEHGWCAQHDAPLFGAVLGAEDVFLPQAIGPSIGASDEAHDSLRQHVSQVIGFGGRQILLRAQGLLELVFESGTASF